MKLDNHSAEEVLAGLSPWKRKRDERWGTCWIRRNRAKARFDGSTYANMDLDIATKLASLKVSRSVVSVVSATVSNEPNVVFMCSGTIIETEPLTNDSYSTTILTSATLLGSYLPSQVKIDVFLHDESSYIAEVYAFDLHYNVAFVKIKSDAPLPVATLKNLSDPNTLISTSKPFMLRPHSKSYKLSPGDPIIALGRYFEKPYDLMAAPGIYSLDTCKLDCKELLRATCRIEKCGVGGPLINQQGEVIGLNFYTGTYTPFLPINLVSKMWKQYKKHGLFHRAWLGMEITNLYATYMETLEKIVLKFPDIVEGVVVEKVVAGSPSDRAGIRSGDIIVKCGKEVVQNVVQFYEIMYKKAGRKVKIGLVREAYHLLNLTMVLEETTPDKFNSWPLPKERLVQVERSRSGR